VSRRLLLPGLLLLAAAGGFATARGWRGPVEDRFGHDRHARLFPTCTTCHAGMAEAGAPAWPEPASCEACHDGRVEKRVDWAPRPGPRPSNLRFDHVAHARTAVTARPADSVEAGSCGACHTEPGASRMAVRPAVAARCLDCHRVAEAHLAQADSSCATCHVPLSGAAALAPAAVAAFPRPPSHDEPGFALRGHGARAPALMASGATGVVASCATCHARDFCITCHVNAPEVAAIQALAPDARSLVHEARLPVPPGHARASFLRDHGREAGPAAASCAACHTSTSCTACHAAGRPAVIAALAVAGPGRGPGAHIARTRPASHTPLFVEGHGPEASARPASCSACHARTECLDCHRPGPGAAGDYHPAGFLVRHPSSAYGRDANCSDCHNPAQFCQACHQQAGLAGSARRLGGVGFHDGARGFAVGHGQAARQTLESCASCHAERDCTACHSAVGGGFRFSPHGPGFNPDRLRRKNVSVCVACHGTGIPGLVP
jgi:hypothetical protein